MRASARCDRWAWVLGVFALAVAALIWRSRALELPQALAAEAVILVGLLPTLWLRRQPRQPVVPLLAIFGVFHAVYFGISLLTVDASRFYGRLKIYALRLAEPLPLEPIMLTILGLVCLYVGYAVVAGLVARRLTLCLPPLHEGTAARLILAGSFTAVLANAIFPGLSQLSSFNQLVEFCRFLLVGSAVLLLTRGHAGMWEKTTILTTVAPVVAFESVRLGLLTFPIYLTIWAVVLGWRFRGRSFPITLILVLVAAAGGLYEAKSYYKKRVAYAEYNATWNLGPNAYVPEWNTLFQANGSDLQRRISYGLVFGVVVDKTPSTVPYWGGETYANLFTNLVPRFLWKDKPTERVGGEFGRRYGFLDPQDDRTSLNIPWLIEAYVNFGPAGLVLVMAAIGGLLALLTQLFISATATPVESVVGGALLFRLAFPESNFTVMTGSIPLMALLLYGGAWLTWLAYRRLRP